MCKCIENVIVCALRTELFFFPQLLCIDFDVFLLVGLVSYLAPRVAPQTRLWKHRQAARRGATVVGSSAYSTRKKLRYVRVVLLFVYQVNSSSAY